MAYESSWNEKSEGWPDPQSRLLIIFNVKKVNHFFKKTKNFHSLTGLVVDKKMTETIYNNIDELNLVSCRRGGVYLIID